MLLSLRVPAENERGPLYMDQALAAIHHANPDCLPLTFVLRRHAGSVGLFCLVPDELSAIVQSQVYAHYPDCIIQQLPDAAQQPPPGGRCWVAELHLSPDLFPIKRYPQFEDAAVRAIADPLTSLLIGLTPHKADPCDPRIEITLRPVPRAVHARADKCLRRLSASFFHAHPRLARCYRTLALSRFAVLRSCGWLLGRLGKPAHHPASADPLHTSAARLHDREQHLQAAADKYGRLLFEAHLRIIVCAAPSAELHALRKLRQLAGTFGIFHAPGLAGFHASRYRSLPIPPTHFDGPSFVLSTEELATIIHPPTLTVRIPALSIVESRELPPPVNLPLPADQMDCATLGYAVYRRTRQRFGILPDDRRRHVLLLGKTGQGKSTLLQHLLTSDIQAGRGCALIDPHGDLTEALLHAIPKHRTNDVILFDAGDMHHPLSFNILAYAGKGQRPLVGSGVLSAFKKLYADSWGPRLEHILRNALLALLETPDASLISLLRLLNDRKYRTSVAEKLTDPAVRAFWQQEFANMPSKLQLEAIAPIQNKVGHFVSSPVLRNILGQTRSSVDFRGVMDQGKVLLVNLSKGRLGDDASALLGSFLVTAMQLAAMGRADTPEADRRDFYLYVDEFQNYATESFATILSEARKYRLALTVANQYLAQMDEHTLAAVFGNVGTIVAFQCGAQDAEILREQLGGELEEQDLLRLPRYHAYVRLLIEGMPSRPFSMRTLPPPSLAGHHDRSAIIRRYCRQRYARPLQQVECEIAAAFAP